MARLGWEKKEDGHVGSVLTVRTETFNSPSHFIPLPFTLLCPLTFALYVCFSCLYLTCYDAEKASAGSAHSQLAEMQ